MQKKDRIVETKFPLHALVRVAQCLQPNEALRLLATCHSVRDTLIHNPDFEGQWVIKSFQNLLSKSGYQGLRNNNLRRIDIHLRAMHFQSESLRRDSGDEQWAILNSWWNMTMVLLLFVTPILMICSEESSESFELYIILTPITVAWFFLFIAYYMIRSQVKRYFSKVFRLMETNQAFK